MLEIKMQANIFCFCTRKAEDIIGTLEKFKPQSWSNLLIYVNQYAFLQTVFFIFVKDTYLLAHSVYDVTGLGGFCLLIKVKTKQQN